MDIGAFQLQFSGWPAPTLTSATANVSLNAGTGLSSAVLSFTVNPNGLPATAFIQYGISTNYGAATAPISLGCGATPSPQTYC